MTSKPIDPRRIGYPATEHERATHERHSRWRGPLLSERDADNIIAARARREAKVRRQLP